MGMSIDKSIEVIRTEKPERPTSMYGIMKKDAFNTAIDTMRKYQKIEELVEYHLLRVLPKDKMSDFQKDILEVVEDGNDDC